ncbi:S1 family peptidase [Rhodococcus sp. SGAir0479]|uniref:S1 family peptidase n=1 Tax=Rhodococcus sp. SGAir0479 TaxID=2567884 RepID=UPI0010CD5D01|nr:S1 family peptidase [Rhodococcus sp. SGAir0479]QCQ92540.1 protease [Rhodococcus sp. SGAir0479]
MRTSLAQRAAVQSIARRAAVLGSSVVLLAVPFTASAHAEPSDSGDSARTSVTQLSADELPADLVEAITRDLRISPQEYLDRAARAQELDSYAADFRNEHPDAFAGAWMGLDGHPVVAVTTTEAAQTATRDGYRTQLAPVSADGLDRALADFNQWVSDLPRQVASQIGNATVDVLNNQIVVDIVNSPIGRAIDLPTHLANVKVQLQSLGGPVPVERSPMGGDTYVTTPGPISAAGEGEVGVCSFGFSGVDRGGNAVNISAGHCDPAPGSGAGVYLPDRANVAASQRIGSFARSEVGGSHALDYSLIRLDDAGTRAGLDRPVIRGAGGSTLTVTGTAVPVVGAPICKSGQTSAFTCGVVSADRVEASLEMLDGTSRTVRGFSGTACTLAGDSGGAIVTGTLALGITSGSNSSYAATCAEANAVLAFDGGTSNLGTPIRDVLAAADATSGGGIGAGLTVRTAAAN